MANDSDGNVVERNVSFNNMQPIGCGISAGGGSGNNLKRARREPPPPLEPDPEPPRSTRSDRRGLPQFASPADRLADYKRHRLDSEQARLDSKDARAGRETSASAVRVRPPRSRSPRAGVPSRPDWKGLALVSDDRIEDALDVKLLALLEPKCVVVAGWRKRDTLPIQRAEEAVRDAADRDRVRGVARAVQYSRG